MSEQEIRVKHLQSQVWAGFRGQYHDIQRIAYNGPSGDGRDDQIVRMVFCAVVAELHMRAADSEGAQ